MKTVKTKIKILIVDDHKLVRDGIITMLKSQNKKYLFAFDQASTGEEGVEKAGKSDYDIILMDYQLPKINGKEATRLILQANPGVKILALSSYDEFAYIHGMVKTGACGFILKNIDPEEFIRAIMAVLEGKQYFSSEVASKLINFNPNDLQISGENTENKKLTILSKREIEVLKLIATEHTNEEIAEKLFLSKRTIDTHRQNMLNKLNVKNTVGLVKYAIEHNLI